MSVEIEKLLAMRNSQKISEQDYLLLLNALKGKEKSSVYSRFINPFQQVVGLRALSMGLLTLTLLSYVGTVAGVYFNSVLNCLVASNLSSAQAVRPHFLLLLAQNTINWLTLSIVFISITLIFKQKRIRVIDYFGTVALSRYPFLALSLVIILFNLITPDLMHKDVANSPVKYHFTIASLLCNFSFLFCWAWQITTYFFALKESSGLNGTKLWAAFVISIFISETITHPLTTLLVLP